MSDRGPQNPWKNDPITEAQWGAIRLIEQNLGIKFKGDRKGQAVAFIGEHIEESKRRAEEFRRALNEANAKTRFLLDDGKGNDIYQDEIYNEVMREEHMWGSD